jgi:hypothetical protein
VGEKKRLLEGLNTRRWKESGKSCDYERYFENDVIDTICQRCMECCLPGRCGFIRRGTLLHEALKRQFSLFI